MLCQLWPIREKKMTTPDETEPVELEVAEQLLTLSRGIPNRVNIAVRSPSNVM